MYVLLAQAVSPDTSILNWMITSLSTFSSLMVIVVAASMFYGAYSLVKNNRPSSLLAAYLVLLPLPVVIAMLGWMFGSIRSLLAIASIPDLAVTNQDIAGGLASSLLSVMLALLVSAPTYILLAYGLLARGFRTPTQGNLEPNSLIQSSQSALVPHAS